MPPRQSPPPRRRPTTRAAHATSPTARKSSTRPTGPGRKKSNAVEKQAVHRRQVNERPQINERPQKSRGAPAHGRTQRSESAVSPKPRERTRERARINPRIAERKNEVARQQGRRRLAVVTFLLMVPAIIASAFVVLHSSLFAITTVNVQGAVQTSQGQIIAAAGLAHHPPLIDVNPIAVATKVESLPWIASATVTRHWPKSVTVTVTERVPVAEANVGQHSWELFDREGRALGYRTSATPGLVLIQKQSDMSQPGAVATGPIGAEVSLADALPVDLSQEIRMVGYLPGDEIIAYLPAGTIAIFGGADALAGKVVALNTLFANHVSLVGVTTVDLRVPSSPVLNSTPLKGLLAKG